MSEMSEMFFNYDQLRAFVWQKKIYLDKEDILYFLCVTEDFFFFFFFTRPSVLPVFTSCPTADWSVFMR